jgi:hypothetical protein
MIRSLIRTLVLVFAVVGSVFASPPIPQDIFDTAEVSASDQRKVLQRLSPSLVFRASFRQEKNVKGLLRPVVSTGKFLFSKDHGIVWNIESPFPSQMVITARGVRKEVQGQPTQFYQVEQDAAAKGVSKLFLGLFGAHEGKPEEVFNIHFQEDAQFWTIGLDPRDSQLKMFLQGIVVQGVTGIEKIWILETGDNTAIEFTNVDQATGLTTEELQFFTDS